jgi:hypothetical protein
LLMGSTFFLPFAAARPIGNRKFWFFIFIS